jgi:hypothetical protein
MTNCPNCGKILRRDIENVYEIDDTKYFDLSLQCEGCNYHKPLTVSRKKTIPRAPDAVTEMAASLKLRQYMPTRKEAFPPLQFVRGETLKKTLNPFKHIRGASIYVGAILLGLFIEIAGLYFEGQMRAVQIDPFAGFILSLLIFIFGPILIVGSAVYYLTKDRLKAILLGSIAVPLTIIILAKLRLDTWGI